MKGKNAFVVVALMLQGMVVSAREKVILDTDIGGDLDDAAAIAYLALEPECDFLGITITGGAPEVRAAMASAVCRHCGRADVPIYPGPGCPMFGSKSCGMPAGREMLDKWPHADFKDDSSAIDFMRRSIRANPGEVTLLAVGPFTNVALLFAMDPEIPALLKQVVVMGGNFSGEAEWNAIADPVATALLYGKNRRIGCRRLLSVGNDVTGKTELGEGEARKFFGKAKSLAPVADFAEHFLRTRHKAVFHDPLAAVCVFHPEVCTYAKVRIEVPMEGEAAGWTLVKGWWNGVKDDERIHEIATGIDSKRFYEIFLGVLSASKRAL